MSSKINNSLTERLLMKTIKKISTSSGTYIFLFFILLSLLIFYCLPQNEYKANLIVESISIGITAGLLTYFTDWLPKNRKKKIAKAKIKQNVNWLVEYMENIISIQLQLFNIHKTIKSITLIDITNTPVMLKSYQTMSQQLADINEQLHANDVVSYSVQIFDTNSKKNIGGYECINQQPFIKFVEEKCEKITECIVDIKRYEYFYSDDIDFFETIIDIENSKFIRDILSDFYKGYFLIGTFGTFYFEFIELYKKLLKLRYNTSYSKTVLINDLEYIKQKIEENETLRHNIESYFK